MRIVKVNWITAHNYGKSKWHSFSPSLSWKGEILGIDIVSQNVPKKRNYWTKMADLGIIFLRRSYLIFLDQLLYPLLVGIMPFRFFCATLYSSQSSLVTGHFTYISHASLHYQNHVTWKWQVKPKEHFIGPGLQMFSSSGILNDHKAITECQKVIPN